MDHSGRLDGIYTDVSLSHRLGGCSELQRAADTTVVGEVGVDDKMRYELLPAWPVSIRQSRIWVSNQYAAFPIFVGWRGRRLI